MKRFIFLMVLFIGACRKDGPFRGKDNDIASFQLTAGATVLKAYLQGDSIVVTAPGNLSLTGARAVVVISERAQISPDPSTVSDWSQPQQFTVTSYDGMKKTYTYVLVRNVISKDGDITLMTQADVDTLSKMGLSRINGNLTIGRADGPDSIVSLSGLSMIATITGSLLVNPTFSGKDLSGLDNLETVGSLQIGPDASSFQQGTLNLKTVSLPRLTEVVSNVIINSPGITSLQMPALTKVGMGLQIAFIDSLVSIAFPRLTSVLQNVTIQGYFLPNSLETISFPALTTVGGDVCISSWANLQTVKFPALTTATSFGIVAESLLTAVDAPRLQTTAGAVDLSYNPALTEMDLSSLKTIGGQLHLEGSSSLQDLKGLKSLTKVGGDLTLASLSSLTDASSLKGLQSVGGNFMLQGLPLLADDNLQSFAGLKTIGGILTIDGVPFSNFTGFGLTKAQAVYVFASGVTTIRNIDLSRLQVTTRIWFMGIPGGASVKGPATFNGELNIESSDIALSGFGIVQEVSFTGVDQPMSSTLTLPFQKVTGNLSIVAPGHSRLSLPNLQEVDASLSIYNTQVTDLNGLASLTKARGIVIQGNPMLVDFTGLKNALGSLDPGQWSVTGNGYNPSYEDMQNGSYTQP